MFNSFLFRVASRLDTSLLCIVFAASVSAKYAPFLDPGFFFDYNKPGEPVPIPITEQCETIHITWGRSNARGPSPVAPYYMQVYASVSTSPFVIPAGGGLSFDWTVPFAPGTLYQICMFAHNGVAGGCQSMYTMVQNSTTSQPVCQNVTVAPQLEVVGKVPGGDLSQYGFVDQCTDISITPKSGKPPFILTVAPALHPPYNITSNSMDSIVWTVSLSWAFPFFLSLLSADGQTWANGPLHAGGFGPSECLAPGTIPWKFAQRLAVGVGVGSLIAGSLVGVALALRFLNRRQAKQRSISYSEPFPPNPPPEYDDARPLPTIPSSTFATRIRESRLLDTGRVRAVADGLRPFPYSRPRLMTDVEAKSFLRNNSLSVPRPLLNIASPRRSASLGALQPPGLPATIEEPRGLLQ